MKQKIIQAAKASHIPEQKSSLWAVFKKEYHKRNLVQHRSKIKIMVPGTITYLAKWTMATLHQPNGEIIMEDTDFELSTHLGFMMQAKGNILVTGLGLGCVIRGALANGNSMHITCIEKSEDVLRMVKPYMPTKNLEIIQADALEWTKQNKFKFDYAWHDLWTDEGKGEPHLNAWHIKLIVNCAKTVKTQGAWSLNRFLKRSIKDRGVNLIG